MTAKINRRTLLAASTLVASLGGRAVGAQSTTEVVVGAIFPFSGANALIGVDARHAIETAFDVVNNPYPDLDLPLAKGTGLPGLGGAKIRAVYSDHQSDPQKGRAEAERLLTQDKVCSILGGYQSAVVSVMSVAAERYQAPFMVIDASSPSLHRRGLKYFFRASAHDEMFSKAMFDFFDAQRKQGRKIETLALFHEDTIFGTDSANAQTALAKERGYKIATTIKYRANAPSLTSEVLQLKAADADVLMPTCYTTDAILLVRTMREVGYKPRNIVAQDAGFSEKALYDAAGAQLEGVISRGSFSIDLSQRRPSVSKVNDMYRARSGKDLNDITARQLMGTLVLAAGIDAAKSTDGTKIRDALSAIDVPGEQTIMPWSRVKFGADGQNVDADPVLLQYVGGKFVTIFPEQAAVAKPVWPMSKS